MKKYDIFHFWAKPYFIPITYNLFKTHFPVDLYLLKKLGKKIVFSTDGCYTMIRPSVWKTKIDPQICHVCQTTQGDTYGFCSNANTIRLNEAMEKYGDLRFGLGINYDFEKDAEYCIYPVDTDEWHPGIKVPDKFVYKRQRPGSLLIYHGVGSHAIGNRGNIKGTDWIIKAVKELQDEGRNIELMHMENCPHNEIKYHQAQADIVVDQLLIGGGGANAKECMALGKPVLTRVHDEQLNSFIKASAPNEPPPYVATDARNLKENLIMLIDNPGLRAEIGKKSRQFAENVLSPENSARRFLAHYEKLY